MVKMLSLSTTTEEAQMTDLKRAKTTLKESYEILVIAEVAAKIIWTDIVSKVKLLYSK